MSKLFKKTSKLAFLPKDERKDQKTCWRKFYYNGESERVLVHLVSDNHGLEYIKKILY